MNKYTRVEDRIAALETELHRLKEQRSSFQIPFRVTDADGKTLLSLDLEEDADQGPLLKLRLHNRQNGEPTVVVQVQQQRGYATLQVGSAVLNGGGRLALGSGEVGALELNATEHGGSIELRGPHSDSPIITLNASDGYPYLHIAGGFGDEQAEFSGTSGVWAGSHPEHRESVLLVENMAGATVAELGAGEDAEGRLTLRDRMGGTVQQIPATPARAEDGAKPCQRTPTGRQAR